MTYLAYLIVSYRLSHAPLPITETDTLWVMACAALEFAVMTAAVGIAIYRDLIAPVVRRIMFRRQLNRMFPLANTRISR